MALLACALKVLQVLLLLLCAGSPLPCGLRLQQNSRGSCRSVAYAADLTCPHCHGSKRCVRPMTACALCSTGAVMCTLSVMLTLAAGMCCVLAYAAGVRHPLRLPHHIQNSVAETQSECMSLRMTDTCRSNPGAAGS